MAKGKSSASSATRKKHAQRKANKNNAGSDDDQPPSQQQQQQLQRGQKKQPKKSRFEPKIKSYTPPPPPPKGLPDPVDLYLRGGKAVDPELVVVLRKLGKKDEATVFKGVEGFSLWVDGVEGDNKGEQQDQEDWEREVRREELQKVIPVWAHHFPHLSLHPSRRIRHLTLTLHLTLLKSPLTRSVLLSPQFLEQEKYLTSCLMSSWDLDRTVRGVGKRCWDELVLLGGQHEEEAALVREYEETILGEMEGFVFPSPTSTSTSTSSNAATEDDPAHLTTTLRTQSLLALNSILPLLTSLPPILRNRNLYSLLSPQLSEPPVRSAVYDVLDSLAKLEEGNRRVEFDEGWVREVARSVLKYCWVEKEGWVGVVGFLRRHNEAWELAGLPEEEEGEEEQDSDEDRNEEEEDNEDGDDEEGGEGIEPSASATSKTPADAPTPPPTPNPAIQSLLHHLSLGCTFNPSLYPTILLLLSTIPASLLPSPNLFFETFWSAWGSRALIGMGAEAEFVRALGEGLGYYSTVFPEGERGEEMTQLRREMVGRCWTVLVGAPGGEVVGKNVGKRDRNAVAGVLREGLERWAAKSQDVFDPIFDKISTISLELLVPSDPTLTLLPLDALPASLLVLSSTSNPLLATRTKALVGELVKIALSQLGTRGGAGEERWINFVRPVLPIIAGEKDVEKVVGVFSTQSLPALLRSASVSTRKASLPLLVSLLTSPSEDVEKKGEIWISVFSNSSGTSNLDIETVLGLLNAGLITDDLPNVGEWMDEIVLAWGLSCIGPDGGKEKELEAVKTILRCPHPFVSLSLPAQLLLLISNKVETVVRSTLSLSSSTKPSLDTLLPCTELLIAYASSSTSSTTATWEGIPLEDVYIMAYLLEGCRVEVPELVARNSKVVWEKVGDEAAKEVVRKRWRELMVDTDCWASPIELVNAALPIFPHLPDLLPTSSELSSLRSSLIIQPPSPALGVLDELLSHQSASSDDTIAAKNPNRTDYAGLTSYARSLLLVLEIASRDLSFAKQNVWILPHILFFAQTASEQLAFEGSISGVFAVGTERDVLERVSFAAEGLGAFLLSGIGNGLKDGWHAEAVKSLRSKESISVGEGQDEFLAILGQLARKARAEDGIYEQRAVMSCLSAVLKYAEKEEQDAERWLAFAQSLPEGSPLASSIILAIKPVLIESPRFVRYQNELASILSGVPASQADTRGSALLSQLLCTAPPLDAPIIFLPQQRSMFLIQKISGWIASDEDVGEKIHEGIAELFCHLAPIVQELSGSHWDLVFDIIESNLEVASWDDNVSLPALQHSCRLLGVMKDLAASNAELRSTVKSRIDTSLELVQDLFVRRPTSGQRNGPQAAVLETMANLVRDLPAKALKMGPSFDKLVRLLGDPTLSVQLSSYELVDRIAAKYVSDLVVEVEVEKEEPPVIELPAELVLLLSEPLEPGTQDYPKASSFLLAWLIAFRFFESGSPPIKSAYVDQLRKLDLIGTVFLPSIFGLLGLSDRGRPFDVAPWAIDDFRIDLVDDLSSSTLPVFATFVYYRSLQALPSLIRSWWEMCKNRQLSIAISTFTSRHFSPVLVANELAHLRDPNDPIGKALRDNEDFTVKVAAGASEVKAVFIVDEQNMEISIRLPPEFPLQQVEVKDVRKVGVKDDQWRAWLLAIQQVITTQNGLIADALSLFKRNVTLHFDGVEPCAICYSIISVVDRSLPTKKCRTCNNRFHAGCLYKWFSTSHGSSCPLCRSLF
ncbi:hypothetical protein T439DRAFT_104716 [Meredithblackwellia eburnea MCA 4105]